MWKDPLTRWNGPFPYDLLKGVGITPESSLQEVLDALFALMEKGVVDEQTRQAWDELRLLPRRLRVDFFLYELEPAAEIDRARKALETEIETWWNGPLEVQPRARV